MEFRVRVDSSLYLLHSEEVSCSEAVADEEACPPIRSEIEEILLLCLWISFVFNHCWQHDSADSGLIALLSIYKIICPHLVDEPFPARPKVS